MKILYCVGTLSKKGGTEKVSANKTDYFINNLGYEVCIVTEDQKGMPLCYGFHENIKFHDMAVSKLSKKTTKGITFVKNIFLLRKLYSDLFEKVQPDVVVVCERGYHDFVIPFIKKDIPKVREFHFSRKAVKVHAMLLRPLSKRIQHRMRYWILFKMFNKYNYLALLTNADMRDGNYNTQLEVIPNMIEKSKFNRVSKLENKRVISVGSMYDKRKAFDVQIYLWKSIVEKHPNWVLDIYGDGAEKNNLKLLIDNLSLNKNVVLHGNSDNMSEKYLESSIFLFTSLAEGLPMVLIEALSFGLPCVSFDCPTGPSDIITHDIDGYVIKDRNIEILEEKLLMLIESKNLRKDMGAHAIKNAEIFSPKNVAGQWDKFFRKIKSNNEN